MRWKVEWRRGVPHGNGVISAALAASSQLLSESTPRPWKAPARGWSASGGDLPRRASAGERPARGRGCGTAHRLQAGWGGPPSRACPPGRTADLTEALLRLSVRLLTPAGRTIPLLQPGTSDGRTHWPGEHSRCQDGTERRIGGPRQRAPSAVSQWPTSADLT
jgi:hypothetical protein